MINLQPLLDTLAAVSGRRVLPFHDIFQEGEVTRVMVPVCDYNHGDRKDTVLRRFAADWLKKNIEEKIAVDVRYEPLPPGQAYHKDGQEHAVVAALVLTWWPKPHETEYEQWRKGQRAERAQAAG